jgi:hypothetical protein
MQIVARRNGVRRTHQAKATSLKVARFGEDVSRGQAVSVPLCAMTSGAMSPIELLAQVIGGDDLGV